jgi:hypothetical protein
MGGLRKIDTAMKSAIRKKALLEKLRDPLYQLRPQDQTMLISMVCDYEDQIEALLKEFMGRVKK